MRKFKIIDGIYAILAYFMIFLFLGMIFDAMPVLISYSISIFIILYLAYWIIRWIKDVIKYTFAEIELIQDDIKEKRKQNENNNNS